MCATPATKERPDRIPGYVIFPEKSSTQVIQLDMSVESPEIPKGSRLAVPVLVGCVDYTLGTGTEHHQTGFALDLRMSNLLAILLDRAPIPAESLKVTQWPDGSFFAN
jgi:hypothetical protein